MRVGGAEQGYHGCLQDEAQVHGRRVVGHEETASGNDSGAHFQAVLSRQIHHGTVDLPSYLLGEPPVSRSTKDDCSKAVALEERIG